METIILATNNKHKLSELRDILKDHYTVLSLNDANIEIDIPETGKTFYDNALIKARTICNITKLITIADDSGLMVNALNGAPGVYSSRFASENCSTEENNAKLLRLMTGIEERKAKFVTVIVMHYPDGRIVSGMGEAMGTILFEERGTAGFGYDPLFFSDVLKKTFAEASPVEKNLVSHRACAIRNLLQNLNGSFKF
ncbi:MAG: RdgB/HAM1 family non-canonical purine NTP pyrophosphatase [Christensenellaceae bacterium]|jgi:XTP/dITP diphosphohydrolase|nr:RdgB/HAM1 family non-canonical purine NTP pyrophosphatase [Christensenellaceae bacterium]